MTSGVLKMANLMQKIMNGYQRRIKRRYNRLKGLKIILHGKARFRGVVGDLVFDLKLYLINYVIVIMDCV
jgi:hypothetical protein